MGDEAKVSLLAKPLELQFYFVPFSKAAKLPGFTSFLLFCLKHPLLFIWIGKPVFKPTPEPTSMALGALVLVGSKVPALCLPCEANLGPPQERAKGF